MEFLPAILAFLQPLLMKCWDKTSMEDPQEFLRDNFNSATGKMDPGVVADAIPAARRAVRKAHQNASREDRKKFVRLTKDELRVIAEKSLIESMNAPPETVASVRAAAAGMPDED